jgi:hypothetical protein
MDLTAYAYSPIFGKQVKTPNQRITNPVKRVVKITGKRTIKNYIGSEIKIIRTKII